MNEDELRAALREALALPEGPPPGVKFWSVQELAELAGVSRDTAQPRALLAVKEGRMERAWLRSGYVYWFAR